MKVSSLFLVISSVLLLLIIQNGDCASAGTRPAAPARAEPIIPSAQDTKKKGMSHPAFNQAGQSKGVEIWRIENFEPVAVPRSDYGKFYSGDSYIILNTKEDNKKKLSWDLHFWLGSKTTQDESGSAAYLTVALDDKLGGGPVQHREVQGFESPLFLGYFKPAIRYLDGGHATGFSHVTTNAGAEKRMFQVKGNKNIRVKQVEPTISSMNKGDCFILDVEHSIYVYVGPNARRIEKMKAISVGNQIRDQDHKGRAKIEIIDEFSNENDFEKFFSALGSGSKNTVPEDTAGGDDQKFETSEANSVSLYHVSDETGKLEVKPISQKPFKQEQLNENDCYVLDALSGGIYVWVGKKCNQRERTESMAKAQVYLQSKTYPAWVHITRVPQGTEPAAFKQYFSTWRDHGELHSRLIRSVSDEEMYSSDDEVAQSRIKAVAKSGSARGFMPDMGDGHTVVFRVQDSDLVKVADSKEPEKSTQDGSKYGQFYQGDVYVITYEYNDKDGKPVHIIAYWIGKDATADEKEAAFNQAKSMNEKFGGDNVMIKIPQGGEPKHFLKLFKGKMVTQLGGRAADFKVQNTRDSYESDSVRLFHIEGNEIGGDIRAEQVPEKTISLNHDDAFLLETSNNVYAWIGKEASASEKEAVYQFTHEIFGKDKEPVVINDGEEPDDFWSALGGAPVTIKKSQSIKQRTRLRVGREPHLLQVNVRFGGRVSLQDIGGYSQEDLDDDAVFVLDSGEEIYIWVGNEASNLEKDSIQTAIKQYLKNDPLDRTIDNSVVIIIKQDREPEVFKKMFDEWDENMWKKQTSYDDIKSKMIAMNEIL